MGFEPGGMGDKLGNRYEGRWVAKQLLRLLNEEVLSVTIELIGPDERGVDLLVVIAPWGTPLTNWTKRRV